MMMLMLLIMMMKRRLAYFDDSNVSFSTQMIVMGADRDVTVTKFIGSCFTEIQQWANALGQTVQPSLIGKKQA